MHPNKDPKKAKKDVEKIIFSEPEKRSKETTANKLAPVFMPIIFGVVRGFLVTICKKNPEIVNCIAAHIPTRARGNLYSYIISRYSLLKIFLKLISVGETSPKSKHIIKRMQMMKVRKNKK